MSRNQPIIVDTNILFSALLNSQSSFANLLFQGEYSYFICELVLVELFKRKEKIIKVSQLSENEVVRIYQILLQRLNLYKEELIAPNHRAALLHF